MTDIADRAAEREEEINADALLEHHLHDPTANKTVFDSAMICCGCSCEIPAQRRDAIPGVQLCRDCQDDADFIAAAARRNGRPI